MPLTVYIPESVTQKALVWYIQNKMPGCNFADRLYRKLIDNKGMLRVDPRYPEKKLMQIIESSTKQLPILHLMLHSSELSLNCSPFSRTESHCELVWKRLEKIFKFAHSNQFSGRSLTEAANLIAANLAEKKYRP